MPHSAKTMRMANGGASPVAKSAGCVACGHPACHNAPVSLHRAAKAMPVWTFLQNLAPELLGTLIVIVAVVAANLTITAVLRTRTWISRDTKLRTSVFWRNFSLLLALLSLLFVWRAELHAAALSLAALSVALVLAGKELLTSILGYIHRTTSGSFEFGNVIEINGVKGEVIDQTLLSTTVLEMSEEHLFTGRTIQFPNSFYVAHPLKNHSPLGPFQLGLLKVPLAATSDVDEERKKLIDVAREVCGYFVAPAQTALRELEGEQFIVMPSAEPRVTIRLVEAGKIVLLLRYPCPADQRTRTEQEIIARYLAAQRTKQPAPNQGGS
jgi:small-conductance mechanosensitive channel